MFEKFYFDLLSLKTEMQFRGYSTSTQKTYYKTVKDFLEVTGKEAIDIKRGDIIRYLDNNLKLLNINTILRKSKNIAFQVIFLYIVCYLCCKFFAYFIFL